MKIIHTVQSLDKVTGGPAYSVPSLARALQKEGVTVEVWTEHRGDGEAGDLLIKEMGMSEVKESLSAEGGGTIVHDHGVWLPWNHAVAGAARSAGVPRVVSPRGMLEPWALRHKWWKKRVAWWLFQRSDLKAAQLWHATADAEAENLKALGLKRPIMVAANGVELPGTLLARHAESKPLRVIQFISRIHPKKGLLNLVEAWARVREEGWVVKVAGPDEGGHVEEVRRLAAELRVGEDFKFLPQLDAQERDDVLCEADVFVLPSFSENFGMVVAEALAAGLPVITTKGTPWGVMEERGCGWWVEVGVEPLVEALREAMALSAEERRAMGARGRELVTQSFGWRGIAQRMVPEYNALLI